MKFMSHIDHLSSLDLDGHLLRLFVAVLEEGSVTRAAHRLGLTQSAVSHALDKLRGIVGEALFVRSGRGIVATRFAEELAPRARELLNQLDAFARPERFDALTWQTTITIAANDLQRDLLLPPLMERLRRRAPEIRLRVIPSGVPGPELLRDAGCDLLVTPRPPDAADVVHRRLFEDHYRVFFDARQVDPPKRRSDFLALDHLAVIHESDRRMDVDVWLERRRIDRRIRVVLTGFGGLPAFLRGGPYCCTMPSLLQHGLLHGFASAPCPVPTPAMPMYLCWHVRHQHDPARQWLREEILAVAAPWSDATISPSPSHRPRSTPS